jgi:uncharacterized SAM-binding protein YcdF (DUF218 family)
MGRRERPAGRFRRLVETVSIGFTALFLLVHSTPLVGWYAGFLAHPWDDPKGDILIVLANEQQTDNVIGLGSYWRAVYAVRAWHGGRFRAVVVSGGAHKNAGKSMAAAIGDFLACAGIPREKIFLEERSASTRENALYTKNMIAGWPGTKVLLTSDYHIFRASRAFEAAGLHVVASAFPDVLKRKNSIVNRGPCFWELGVETVKIVYYRGKGWIHLF